MDSKWFALSRRFWLRLSAAVAVLVTALSVVTPETAQEIATAACAAIGDGCDPAALRARIVALAALAALGFKVWRMASPDGAPPLRLRP